MKNFLPLVLLTALFSGWGVTHAQCIIDTANLTTGFSPATPAVIKPGVAYSQTVQVYVPASYGAYIIDSLQIDTITGVPSGISYILNPASGALIGGSNGVICFSGITDDSVGLYPLTFSGTMFLDGGPLPISTVSQLDPSFGYKFRIETTPVAAFTIDSPVCSISDSVTFVDHSGGYPTRWAWSFSGGSPATSTKQYPVVYYDSAGTYAVTLIAKNSISNDTLTQSITVNPSPAGNVTSLPATADSIANGSALLIVSTGTAPFTYLWSNGATGDSLNNVIQGVYGVSVTDARGCQFVNDSVNVSFINSVIQLTEKQRVNIYPNPASDILNMVWSMPSDAIVTIVDLNGNIVSSFMSNGSMTNTYDIHGLAAGSYIIRITDKSSNQQQSMLFSKF